MLQFLNGCIAIITSARGALAILVVMIGGILVISGHRWWGVFEMALGLGFIFSAQQLVSQLGFVG